MSEAFPNTQGSGKHPLSGFHGISLRDLLSHNFVHGASVSNQNSSVSDASCSVPLSGLLLVGLLGRLLGGLLLGGLLLLLHSVSSSKQKQNCLVAKAEHVRALFATIAWPAWRCMDSVSKSFAHRAGVPPLLCHPIVLLRVMSTNKTQKTFSGSNLWPILPAVCRTRRVTFRETF